MEARFVTFCLGVAIVGAIVGAVPGAIVGFVIDAIRMALLRRGSLEGGRRPSVVWTCVIAGAVLGVPAAVGLALWVIGSLPGIIALP
jgi:hypothetical protein